MATGSIEPGAASRAAPADPTARASVVRSGRAGVDGQDDEQGGEDEFRTLDAAEQCRADQPAGECAQGPGGVQAELRREDAAAGQLGGVPAGGEGVRLVAEREDAVRHAGAALHAVQRERKAVIHADLVAKDLATVEAFEERVAAMDEVAELRRMFALPDYLLRVQVADLDTYERWLMTRLLGDPAIARVDSRITMKLIKLRR